MRTPKKQSQQGAATIQILMLVGLMGLVAGAAMLDVNHQLAETARSGEESMEASSLGHNRGTFNGLMNTTSSGLGSQASSRAAAENSRASNQAALCRKPDGSLPRSGERCGRGFWDSLLNVGSSVYSSVVDGSGNSQDSFNEAAVDGAADAATGIWDGIEGGAQVAWNWLSDENYREEIAVNLRSDTWEIITNPIDTFDKIVAWGNKTIDGIDQAVKAASDVVDSGDAEAIARQNGSIVGGGVVELAATALGGAALKGAKVVAKTKVGNRTSGLSDSVDAPSKTRVKVPKKVIAAVDPRIVAGIKKRLRKPGDQMRLPASIQGEKLNKSGLLELLNHAPDEYAIIRAKSTNELYLIRGSERHVGFIKGVEGEQRVIYHNHPSNVALPSGRDMLSFAKKKGDIYGVKNRNPRQQSTIIGSRNGTYRHRTPSREEIGSGELPSIKDDIIGGTGALDTPEMKEHIAIADAQAAKVAAKYAPRNSNASTLATSKKTQPAPLNDITEADGKQIARSAQRASVANDNLPAKASLTNKETRQWYHDQLEAIPAQLDSKLPIKKRAQQAFQARNAIKLKARELMSDRKAADGLPAPRSLDEVVKRAEASGAKGDEVWEYVLRGSGKSDPKVDASLGMSRITPITRNLSTEKLATPPKLEPSNDNALSKIDIHPIGQAK